jgi:prepilin-type N-terminal cleavage/methylation domain-containing protein
MLFGKVADSERTARARRQGGWSLMEVMMVIAMMAILAAMAMPRMVGVGEAMRLRSATDAAKNQLLAARMRAVANANMHCGVYFDVGNKRCLMFFDKSTPVNNQYDAGTDAIYGTVYTLPVGIVFEIPGSGGLTNSSVVYRGDGSAKFGGDVYVKDDKGNKRTINVLASTGRVKVTLK